MRNITHSPSQIQSKPIEIIGTHSDNSNGRTNGSDSNNSNYRSSFLEALLEPDFIPAPSQPCATERKQKTTPKSKRKQLPMPPHDIAKRALARNANHAELLQEELDTLQCKKLSCDGLNKAELTRLEFLKSILGRVEA